MAGNISQAFDCDSDSPLTVGVIVAVIATPWLRSCVLGRVCL